MALQNDTTPEIAEKEIVSTRILPFPPEKVFEALENPRILARWWGPAGFTNTFQTFDFRPGGAWTFVMHGPDGTDYPNQNVFVDLLAPERIVFDHVMPPVFRMTLTLAPVGEDKTRFGFHMAFESAEVCQSLKSRCLPANEQNFDRLEAVLADL